jgi:hypothetical protein
MGTFSHGGHLQGILYLASLFVFLGDPDPFALLHSKAYFCVSCGSGLLLLYVVQKSLQ